MVLSNAIYENLLVSHVCNLFNASWLLVQVRAVFC